MASDGQKQTYLSSQKYLVFDGALLLIYVHWMLLADYVSKARGYLYMEVCVNIRHFLTYIICD